MAQQDVDLQKIQILESSYQGWFSFRASLLAGGIVGALVLVATMYYQNVVDLYGAYIGYAIVIGATLYFIRDVKKAHNEHINFISGLILRIETGEKLESIEELRKMKGKNAKTEKTKPKLEEVSEFVSQKNKLGENKPKTESEINEEREFQLALVDAQIRASAIDSIFAVVIAVGYSISLTSYAVSLTQIPDALRELLLYTSLISVLVAIIMTVMLGIYLVYLHPKKMTKIRKKFIDKRKDHE